MVSSNDPEVLMAEQGAARRALGEYERVKRDLREHEAGCNRCSAYWPHHCRDWFDIFHRLDILRHEAVKAGVCFPDVCAFQGHSPDCKAAS